MMSALVRTVGTGTANAATSVSTAAATGTFQLVMVTAKYSGAPTQTGVTVTLNSGAGAGYDTLLTTGTANAQSTVYVPAGPVFLSVDDVIDVVAPAGGGSLTSSVAIYTRPA